MLFAGGNSVFYSAQISQAGLVPAGTKSLLFEAYNAGAPFVVTLGGQVISVIPLQTFTKYTLYGGNVSSPVGEVETLSFTQPPATGAQPGILELDGIQFSRTSVVPEPGTIGLAALSGLLMGLRRWWKISK